MVDGACGTGIHSYQSDLGHQTEHWIKFKEALYYDADLSNLFDDKESWFSQLEVVGQIYHQFFFPADRFGQQPISSKSFQPLALQTLVLAATAIYCALSLYTSGMKVTVMFSQNEYEGSLGSSRVINFTLEAIALSITHQSATLYPPLWHFSAWIEALLFHSAVNSYSFGASQPG